MQQGLSKVADVPVPSDVSAENLEQAVGSSQCRHRHV